MQIEVSKIEGQFRSSKFHADIVDRQLQMYVVVSSSATCSFRMKIGPSCTVSSNFVQCDAGREIPVLFAFDGTVANPDANTFVRVGARSSTGEIVALPLSTGRCERTTPGDEDGLVMGANIVTEMRTPPVTTFENELKNQCDLAGFGGVEWQVRLTKIEGTNGGKLRNYRSDDCGFAEGGCEVFAQVCILDEPFPSSCPNPGNEESLGSIDNNYPSPAKCTRTSVVNKGADSKSHTYSSGSEPTSPVLTAPGKRREIKYVGDKCQPFVDRPVLTVVALNAIHSHIWTMGGA